MISQADFYKSPLKKRKKEKSMKHILISNLFLFLLLSLYLLKILIIQIVLVLLWAITLYSPAPVLACLISAPCVCVSLWPWGAVGQQILCPCKGRSRLSRKIVIWHSPPCRTIVLMDSPWGEKGSLAHVPQCFDLLKLLTLDVKLLPQVVFLV